MRHVAQNDDQQVEANSVAGLSEAGTAELLRALVQSPGKRVVSASVDGRRVWIKRYDAKNRGFAKWLHAAGSALAFHPFLRSSPWLTPSAQAQRELRKSRAFRAAGFATPTLYYHRDAVVVQGHCEPMLNVYLRTLRAEPAAFDAILARSADALGRAHAAGLCHGRPHPRDLFLQAGQIGFLDFEEEPEAVMPLQVAQARDMWLLMQPITELAMTPGGAAAALEAWRRAAPAAAVAELRRAAKLFAPVTKLLSILGKIMPLGGDAHRIRNAGLLLLETLDSTQTGKTPAPNGKSAP